MSREGVKDNSFGLHFLSISLTCAFRIERTLNLSRKTVMSLIISGHPTTLRPASGVFFRPTFTHPKSYLSQRPAKDSGNKPGENFSNPFNVSHGVYALQIALLDNSL